MQNILPQSYYYFLLSFTIICQTFTFFIISQKLEIFVFRKHAINPRIIHETVKLALEFYHET